MQASLQDISLVLGEVAIFRGLPAAVSAEIARSVQILSLPKGARVYACGERPKALYHVMSGHLKVGVSSPDGGEKVIELLAPKQVFGVAELFGEHFVRCYSAIKETEFEEFFEVISPWERRFLLLNV